MFRILGAIPGERQAEVAQSLDRGARANRDYVLLVLFSCVIATFGLVQNSGAVIIGAMLIAPLMSSILAFALALLLGDLARAAKALGTLALGVVLALALSTALGLLASSGQVNFLEQLPLEVLGRTRPSLFDLAIALAGGAAAAYALAQPHLSAALPGVAIATALMPPICVVGIGLSQERMDVAEGAMLLFLANFVAITFAGSVVFAAMGFGPHEAVRRKGAIPLALVLSTALLLVVSVPLGLFMVSVAREAQQNQAIRATLGTQLASVGGGTLASFDKRATSDGQLEIVASVRSPRSLSYGEAIQIQRELAAHLDVPVALKLLVVPMTTLDTLNPPTHTPTRTPTPRAAVVVPSIPISVVSVVPMPTSTVPTLAATATPAPTSTPRPTSTATPSPTAISTPTPGLTPSPAPTPSSYAVVRGTDGDGANMHPTPGLVQPMAVLPDGALVQLTGRQASADGYDWREVTILDGRTGWVASAYLVAYQPFRLP